PTGQQWEFLGSRNRRKVAQMDTRIAPGGIRLDVVATDSATRVTPSSEIPFHDILAGGAGALLRGAQAAVSALPGAPIVAAAGGPEGSGLTASPPPVGAGAIGAVAPVPGTVPSSIPVPVVQGSAESPVATPATGTSETTALDGALAQSQQFNLY